MAPLVPVFLALFSLFAASAFAVNFDDDGGYGSAGYYAEQNRQHEQRMEMYRQEEQAAQYRTQQDAARMQEPTMYSGPSWESPTKSFLFSNGNDPKDMKLCTASKTGGVSCF
jgi:hypothetical protein